MVERYTAPKFDLLDKRLVELNFEGLVGAGAHLTLPIPSISYPFRILQAKMVFTNEANNLVRVYWLTSTDNNPSTVAVPTGDNIFGKENPTQYFVGKAIIKRVNANVIIPDRNIFIKCHINNTLAYAYRVNNSLIIQEI
ncbi:MAG: hypothetical protein HWN68_12835 [Desulfobacterales bacterium]|nr:hypothetical protein [Desulfobacterales bacterium]